MSPRSTCVTALWIGWLLAAPSTQAALPAVAHGSVAPSKPASSSTRFSIHGDEIIVPMPAGYCQPREADAEQMRNLAAAWEKLYIQLGAALVPCLLDVRSTTTPVALAVGFVVTPQEIVGSRPEILKALAARLDSVNGHIEIESGIRQAREALKDTMGLDIKLDLSPKVVGVDDNGVYLIAFANIMADNLQKRGTLVESMTVTHGRLMVYLFVARIGSPTDTATIVAMAKSETKRFVEANETLTG